MAKFLFPGLNLALATPFDEAGRLDFSRLERNLETFIGVGVASFVVSSGTGIGLPVMNAADAGRWDEARQIWRRLEPAMSLIWEGDYVKTVYAAAALMGYGAGIPRRPLSALAPERMDTLRAALQNLAKLETAGD